MILVGIGRVDRERQLEQVGTHRRKALRGLEDQLRAERRIVELIEQRLEHHGDTDPVALGDHGATDLLLGLGQRAVGAVRQQQLGARGAAGLRLFDRPAVEEFGRALLRVTQVALRLECSGETDRRRLGAGVDELRDRVLRFEHDAGGVGRNRPHHLIFEIGDLLRRQRIGIVGAHERPQ